MSHNLDSLNKDLLKRNAATLKEQGVDVSGQLPIDLSQELPADKKAEKVLQGQCETYLLRHGGARLTAINALEWTEGKILRPDFWFFHVKQRAKTTKVILPLQPDLTLYDWQLRTLLVELKVNERYQKGQKELIDAGLWKLVKSYQQFIEVFHGWMGVV